MSNVIPFKPDRRSHTDASGERQTAAILFFTGVRYVRLLDADPVSAVPSGQPVESEIDADGRAVIERLQA